LIERLVVNCRDRHYRYLTDRLSYLCDRQNAPQGDGIRIRNSSKWMKGFLA
jgi:hypothetical protein